MKISNKLHVKYHHTDDVISCSLMNDRRTCTHTQTSSDTYTVHTQANCQQQSNNKHSHLVKLQLLNNNTIQRYHMLKQPCEPLNH